MTVETISVLGAGAFGTALAMTLAEASASGSVTLWGRDAPAMEAMARDRVNARRLPGLRFPDALVPTHDMALATEADIVLLAVPTQKLRAVLETLKTRLQRPTPPVLVACCKGLEQSTGLLPTQIITDVIPGARAGVLTGPSFATDIAAGKPTALTLALNDPEEDAIQKRLSTSTLRLYLSEDLVGAQLGGALKNVVAIAAGIAVGAGLGDSARAALMARAFSEMMGYVIARGGTPATLFGLSGFGDLVLTCTSEQSRNFRHGLAVGAGRPIDPDVTVEGVTTAHAMVASLERDRAETGADGADVLPVTTTVSHLLKGRISVSDAQALLLQRPLARE